ncbi:MAG: MotA/TolQ/ExbB proton channel family protein [Planctomycetota bacterium]|nr:MAG: MotA/TolQ/ExbB proton channel family protein [Planctomycetota bacterium]REJ95591.1 MAG: MotA/TolQ/ExbB proton channel family protein [Planctomycetota bacterium]REK22631.1 MAG: MotA/TolQ/ExbB proton channel family protein [Planctomycetota bacterium]REK48802.1 MAG: MotA/TolQ/ExbB proton channel family protein [Planctomycetota bacterium]
MTWIVAAAIVAALVVSLGNVAALAADEPAAGAAAADNQDATAQESAGLFEIIFSGGWTGFLIILVLLGLSLTAAGLAIEHLLSIRKEVIMPPRLANDVQAQLLAARVDKAEELCRQQPSFLAFVLQAGIAEVDGGWTAVEKAMEDAAAEQAARLFRKVEYLSVIGNIAPMIGLLGTVTGMIFAFQEVANTQGAARAPQLATGIYQALVTTVGGLLVAIPSLAAFAVFRNRVDQLVAEGSYMAQHVFLPLKRRRTARKSSAAPAGGVPPSTAAAPPPGTTAPPPQQ